MEILLQHSYTFLIKCDTCCFIVMTYFSTKSTVFCRVRITKNTMLIDFSTESPFRQHNIAPVDMTLIIHKQLWWNATHVVLSWSSHLDIRLTGKKPLHPMGVTTRELASSEGQMSNERIEPLTYKLRRCIAPTWHGCYRNTWGVPAPETYTF